MVGVVEKPKGGMGRERRGPAGCDSLQHVHENLSARTEEQFRFKAYPGKLDQAVDEARKCCGVGGTCRTTAEQFQHRDATQEVEEFHEIVGRVALATVVLSSIGLLIGGVGVMNIMLVSVTERTREIGVRKAIGAAQADITWQFLLEAMTLTGAGGIIGVFLAGGIASLIPRLTDMHSSVPVWAILLGLVVSIGVGLVFGVWPAVKAARLDPVEALRHE